MDRTHHTTHHIAYKLISDILSQQDILLSVNSGSGISEARVVHLKQEWRKDYLSELESNYTFRAIYGSYYG
ncbi:MAG: hypothetical protein QN732_11495 [Nitrososphaeraceae archaeon]|nr:hypothetical protein [Nitrososphaeraceae archaeon]